MLNKRLVATTALVVAIAIPSTVWAAEQAKPKDTKASVAQATSAQTAPEPATPTLAKPDKQSANPTLEENLKKFKNAPDTTVVAIVGGEKITKGELMEALWNWSAPQVLEECINSKIIMQAAKKEGLTVTQEEIDARIAEIMARQIQPGDSLEAALQRNKATRARFDSQLKGQIALEKIIEKQTKLTDADYSEFIKARHIFIRIGLDDPNASAEEREKAEAEAKANTEKILAEIRAGKSFEQAAKEYSQDLRTKDTGGKLEWFRRYEMPPQLSDAAFKLKAGEISEPVQTQQGYHLVKIDKLGKDASPNEKAEIKKRILSQRMGMELGKVFNEAKNNTKVENFLAPQLPDPNRAEMMPR